MVVLGIALVGLLPLAVVHSRVMRSLEQRYSSQGDWYLAASQNSWVQKLGAPARLSATDPGAMPELPEYVIDDGDIDYSDDGWTEEVAPSAFGEDLHRAAPAEGLTATWSFADVPVGWYQVQATWTESPTQSNIATYEIYNGEDLVGEPAVDQQVVPAGVEYDGHPWQIVETKYFDAGSVQVRLGSQATAEVVADCVRLVLVENEVKIISMDHSLDSENVTVHVSITVQVPE